MKPYQIPFPFFCCDCRVPKVLASYRSMKVKRSEEEIIASLDGYYKPDQLYLLQTN